MPAPRIAKNVVRVVGFGKCWVSDVLRGWGVRDAGRYDAISMTQTEPGLLQTFLSGHDVACPACGYNLRDLQGSRCPECGDELHLQVGLVEPRQAAAIAGLIGLAAGAGMSGLLLGYAAIQAIMRPYPISMLDRFVLLNGGGFIVEGVAILFWLRNWRRIRRLGAARRRVLVLACWGLSLLNLLIFSIYIR